MTLNQIVLDRRWYKIHARNVPRYESWFKVYNWILRLKKVCGLKNNQNRMWIFGMSNAEIETQSGVQSVGNILRLTELE